VGFASSPEGPFRWFRVEELPTRDDLKALGVSTINVRLCETDPVLVTALLKERGVTITLTDSFAPPSGRTRVEHNFRPTDAHRRALLKIVFNYLAKQHGRAVALEPRFDWIRRFVLDGIAPGDTYYRVDEDPLIDGEPSGKRYGGHILALLDRPHGVHGAVGLFNQIRHVFVLAQGGDRLEPRGHFFDVTHRTITELSRT
jgi:hypothetical protein